MESSSSQSRELRPVFSTEPRTIAETIESNPDAAEKYRWIDESDYDSIYVIVDDFPSLKNGMRAFHSDISRALSRDDTDACKSFGGERIRFYLVMDKDGRPEKINASSNVSGSCEWLIRRVIISQQWEPGKVDGEHVLTYFGVPIKL